MKHGALAVLTLTTAAACGDNEVAQQPAATMQLTTDGALGYAAPIGLGGQEFAAKLDTTTSMTAVAAASCASDCAGVSPRYAPGSTARDRDVIVRGDGANRARWSGEVWQDAVALGAMSTVPLDFVAIDAEDDVFDGNAFQAIVGIGPTGVAAPQTTGLLAELADTGVDPTVSFQLCPDRGQLWLGGGAAGALAAGAVTAQVPAQIAPLLPGRRLDAVAVTQLSIGGAEIGAAPSIGDTVIDLGTGVSVLPSTVVDALLAHVDSSPAFQALFPGQALTDDDAGACVTSSSVTTEELDALLPALTISFGGIQLPLQPSRSYIDVAGDGRFCLAITAGGNAPGSVLGAGMLQSFVTTIDVGAQTVAFQPESGCETASAQRGAIGDSAARFGRVRGEGRTRARAMLGE